MDTPNSQKRSPRSSAKSKQDSSGTPETLHRPFTESDEEKYMDFSMGMVARVRAAKEAAQREMEFFGSVSEYDITTLQGQLKEESVAPSQPPLDFESQPKETD